MNIDITILTGNLTSNAEMKFLASGCAVINCKIAVNRPRKKDGNWIDYANFFDLQIMGKSAENLHKYLTRGRKITIEGELRQDRWVADNQPHQKVYIKVQELELGQPPKGSSGVSGESQQGCVHSVEISGSPTSPTIRTPWTTSQQPPSQEEDIPQSRWNFDDINLDDDIPF